MYNSYSLFVFQNKQPLNMGPIFSKKTPKHETISLTAQGHIFSNSRKFWKICTFQGRSLYAVYKQFLCSRQASRGKNIIWMIIIVYLAKVMGAVNNKNPAHHCGLSCTGSLSKNKNKTKNKTKQKTINYGYMYRFGCTSCTHVTPLTKPNLNIPPPPH